ncbi:MAG TPA: ABC transporter ATP-binding protein [Anaerolineales bacterium]|nr:ABC transporter ATP-binding protein [Anaerolineales bacterium]
MALIEAHDLHKTFRQTKAVDGVSLTVSTGEAYGIVGPDGAGKTTTMRLLVGALGLDNGSVVIAGHDLHRHAEDARAQIGYLAQRFSLYTDLTVYENLRFFGEVRGVIGAAFEARAQELLKFVGLAGFEKRLAGNLSGGMKQKLGLASALVHRPKVLLLDEPTGGVDPVTRQDFWQLIIRLLSTEGIAVVVSTPYMDEAARCSRIGFMYRGRILTHGSPREITASMEGRVLELIAHPKDKARETSLADPDVEDALAFGDRLHLRVRSTEAAMNRLPPALQAAGVTVSRLRPIPPSLEDAFISILAMSQHADNADRTDQR